MDWLTRVGLERTRLTVLIMMALLVQGVILYGGFPKREDPAITIRNVIVSAELSGVRPERIESLLAIPIERKAREIGEIDDITSRVTDGQVIITLEVSNEVPEENLERVFQEIRDKMSTLEGSLPDGTRGPNVNTDFGSVTVATVAVTGEGFNYAELEDAAQSLQESLYAISGIGKVFLMGVQEQRVWLEFDASKLAATGVQINKLVNDLQAQNVLRSAGELNASDSRIAVQVNGNLNSPDEIAQLLTQVEGLEGLIQLGDILEVRAGYVEPPEQPAYFNGEPAIMVGIEMLDGYDVQALGHRIKAAVKAHELTQPIGISYRFSTYQESKVTTAVNSALQNVGTTFAVVALVILLFLGARPALVIAAIVPFSVLFAILGMSWLGIELEQVSIAAVIISLGLLVDNGLVIVEDIKSKIATGAVAKASALKAGKQFFYPLAVASITTVSAFLPMMILDGTEGEYAFSLGAVVGLMLLGSWITALYILPVLSVWLLKKNASADIKKTSPLLTLYGKLLQWALAAAPLVVFFCFALVFISASLFMPRLKNEMFPLSERDQFLIYMDMPSGTSIETTTTTARRVNNWLLDNGQNPEILNTSLYIADGGPRFYLSLDPAEGAPSNAFFLVNTSDFTGAVDAATRAEQHLRLYHPEARFRIKRLSMGGSESGLVEIKISGPDGDRLMSLASQIEAFTDTLPGISENRNDWGNKVFSVVVDVAQDRARQIGTDSESISEILDAYFNGQEVTQLRVDDKRIPVAIRARGVDRDSLDDLQNLSIPVDGSPVVLSQVAQIRAEHDISQLRRENQRRTITVTAKSSLLSAQELFDAISPAVDALAIESPYAVAYDGEVVQSADVYGKLGAGLPIALVVMLLALVAQFNSFRRVTLTFLTIPLIIIGAPIALWATNQPMSFFATLGMISLAGIIINNAIVLIDQIDIDRKSYSLKLAILSASGKRFQPIMLTSLTTVLGLLPMAFSGGALWEPMATLMIGGLLPASLLTLFFVPAMYYLLFRWNNNNRL